MTDPAVGPRAAAGATPPRGGPAVVPAPRRLDVRPGAPFVLRPGTHVVAQPRPEVVSTAVVLAERIGLMCGLPVAVVQGDAGRSRAVVLRLTDDPAEVGAPGGLAAALAAEAYRLEVSEDVVLVTGLGAPGLLRGVHTLLQLAVRPAERAVEVPAVLVEDRPRFAWRGLSLDVARHFVDVPTLHSVIDLASSYKLNVLHLHLTDDQGWRLEVPGRPELTERSGGTAVGGDPGGWYTVGDWSEVLAYAATRHVTVVPEVDVPGHVNAALHACPELNPDGVAAGVYTGVDVGFSRLRLDLPATRPFLADVLGRVAAMTPGPFVHVGGDEAWTVDGPEYVALVRTAVDVVRAAGKRVVGWQETAAADLPRGSVVQYWDERAGAAEVTAAARAGCDVVLSPASRVYLDMRYDDDTPVGQDWAGHVDLRRSYDWEPLDVLPDVPRERVAGVSAALWTETVRTREDLFLLLLPRLAAVAEVAWSAPEVRSWASFAERVAPHGRRWDAAGLAWHPDAGVTW